MPDQPAAGFDVAALLEARGHEAFALHERYVNPQMPRVLRTIGFDADYVRAEGAYLFDRDGRRYLDFLAGFGVFALGRCHPGIEQALRDAMALSLPNLVQMECSPLSGLLAEALVARMPNDSYRCFFTNSGAESVETVLKYVRCATGRSRVLFADHAFHGLTTGALALNGAREFRDRFGTLLPGCASVPFGDLDALDRELRDGDVAAFVVEPIQGKGVFVAPDDYLRDAAELCHRHGALLAIDEVQTGLGRTGTFFAFEQWNVEPDLVTVAKALSGGYVPVGAVIAKSAVVEKVFDTMDRAVVHSSTFGQNVLAMTAGLATLHAIDAESIVEHAATTGGALIDGLRGARRSPRADPRGPRPGLHDRDRVPAAEVEAPPGPVVVARDDAQRAVHAAGDRAALPGPPDPVAGRGRPPERAEDPPAAHHDRTSRPTRSSPRSTTCSRTSRSRSACSSASAVRWRSRRSKPAAEPAACAWPTNRTVRAYFADRPGIQVGVGCPARRSAVCRRRATPHALS